MSLFTDLREVFTSYAQRIKSLAAANEEIKADLEDVDERVEALEGGDSGGSGLTDAVKNALLACFDNVAWNDTNGQTYYDDLYDALYAITAITLNTNSISMQAIGATSQLTATTTPAGGNVTWSSSNTSVATVSSTGLVTSVAYGSATITATAGSVSATCSVVVAQATCTGITASYTQPGTVYDNASLDDLKADLVVTAAWSNGTTSTLNDADYTLSGTLTVGTSTITVAYGGKTATFNVTVTEDTGISAESGTIKTNGTEEENNKRARTDYIPVTSRVFKVSAYVNSDSANTASYAIRYYDANYTFIGPIDSQKTVPIANEGGHYLVRGWLAGDGTEYTDNSELNGVPAYIRLVFRNTADSTITDISGTVTVDGIVHDIVYE